MNIHFLTSSNENEYFYGTYDLYAEFGSDSNKKVYFGSRKERKCRFCGKSEGDVTFKKKAHLVPELMGNKVYFSYFECDTCNNLFNSYEDSLANFGGILHTLAHQKGKRGVPKYKHNFWGEEFQALSEAGKIILRSKSRNPNKPKEIESIKVDEASGRRFSITFNIYPHTPQHVAKIFSKIAIGLVDNQDISQFQQTINWIIDNNPKENLCDYPLHYCIRRVGGRAFPHPQGFLLKKKSLKKDVPSPEFVLLLWYGLFQFQIFVPHNERDEWLWNQEEVILPIENRMAEFKYIDGQLHSKVDVVDLRSNIRTKTKKHSFSIGFTPEQKE